MLHRFCWSRVLFDARTRILAWYVILMATSALLSTVAVRKILLVRMEERVRASIVLEIEEFRRLQQGRNPRTGELFGSNSKALFDVYLSRNLTEENEFFLTLLDGQLYRSSPEALPPLLQPQSEYVQRWGQTTQTEEGTLQTPFGKVLYLAEPVASTRFDSTSTPAVFVIVRFLTSQEQDVVEAVNVLVNVSLAVLGIASVLAWIAAGRILAPLRSLTETARSISDSDLSQRIAVQGNDDIAEMGATFNEMLERLQTAFVNQRNFVNDVSHELRTPITIIRGHLELLDDDPLERRTTIDLVTDELDRMSRFVEDLLLLAKAEQPNFLNLETVDIQALTDELFSKATALADRQWRLDNKGIGRMVADRQRVTQMMMNLTQNATQHTQPGDVIALGSAVVGKEVHFWVRDTGEGIDLDQQKRIFERFVRLNRADRSSSGTGLGLSIVSAIARAHGGRIELVSAPGRGSTFTIVLPFDPP
ncbi:sensor histidine kinase [Thermocoleostomius sinensis]|uniref:histidine kinase n=1 Tax=Thermocoleostomius sinensis A174 TaxID=2016057 RepID=A0A9E9C4W9_9CYAN|nr:HAMP domain-containing sensor histidine kinase [Thermocoleostomius sinensis]WAL60496.1 HAMP domain-containing sensor histidine kinase [Thermocoleostomius sinensis A174]